MTIRLARDKLGHMLGRDPTLSELSEETGLEPEDIAAAEEANLPVASLQMETGEDGFTLESILGTEGMEEGVVERLALRGAIDALPERERQVIFLRYYKGLTQDRAARVLGVSQVQVSASSAKRWSICGKSWRRDPSDAPDKAARIRTLCRFAAIAESYSLL
ncbi:MAG: sigma factor-like helix-turn-helix DNA-binding protein [Intestinimonas sp.]